LDSLADGAQGGFDCRAGGDAIVDHDRRASSDPRTRARPEIERPPAFDFGKLSLARGFELRRGNPGEADHILIANHDRLGAVHHRARGELRLHRRPDLADENQIQRRIEHAATSAATGAPPRCSASTIGWHPLYPASASASLRPASDRLTKAMAPSIR
jgi:hypothetical protein